MAEFKHFKLEIFIPETHFDRLREALQAADAGHIGSYDSCLSYSRVNSTWRPLAGTHPYNGTIGQISDEPELKVEVTIKSEQLTAVLAAARKVHPYEEPLINVLPMILPSLHD